MLTDSTRVVQTDKWFNSDEVSSEYVNHVFVRLIAHDKKFTKVDFKYSIFDGCYLRGCVFDSCNFTGCRFINVNFHGSQFSGCTFDYANFEKTNIDSAILHSECPPHENLKQRFARSLRVNYQQLGDVTAVHKAIGVELRATEEHLKKIWRGNDRYYRKKYVGWKRARGFIDWLGFKTLDFVWGNGESAWKLCRTVLALLLVMTVIDANLYKDGGLVSSYLKSFVQAPQILFGTLVPTEYPTWYLTIILVLRLIAFGFFMSIIIKRFSRR